VAKILLSSYIHRANLIISGQIFKKRQNSKEMAINYKYMPLLLQQKSYISKRK